jgi:hypothetical protein
MYIIFKCIRIDNIKQKYRLWWWYCYKWLKCIFYTRGKCCRACCRCRKFNKYLNLKNAGAAGDWCYLRQNGTSEAHKLAFDFYDDDNDARFCLRSVQSAGPGGVDVIREIFNVDMGNVTCSGTVSSSGNLTCNNST